LRQTSEESKLVSVTPVILCGGSGERLWPLSRKSFPKQFLGLFGETSLFQQSIQRIISLCSDEVKIDEIIIITNEKHRFLVLEQIDEIKINIPCNIILEPEAKNTAPALTLAAYAAKKNNSQTILIVIPSDQYIKHINAFKKSINKAVRLIQDNTIFTVGIKPLSPSTGLGYIEYKNEGEINKVVNFKEKPDHDEALEMINAGNHAWNSGIFILKPKTWIDKIQKANPQIASTIKDSWIKKTEDQWFIRPNPDFFALSPSDSIDYAVMEKMELLNIDVRMVMLDAGWSDLGTYQALAEIQKENKDRNILIGDILTLNSCNNIAISSKRNISLLGVDGLVVIETSDCVFVANKKSLDSIKDLVNKLGANHSYLIEEHTRVNRPWGWFELLDESQGCKVKRIQINPGKSISLQRHKHRSEHWVVVKGEAYVTKGTQSFKLKINESTYIEANQVHRIENLRGKTLQIIEVQSGSYLGEDDIQRIEDKYGR
tara:strand:+ start:1159 stop:2619 length:1461 start_codon:yes stop_codon:yes gene_type:complete